LPAASIDDNRQHQVALAPLGVNGWKLMFEYIVRVNVGRAEQQNVDARCLDRVGNRLWPIASWCELPVGPVLNIERALDRA